jgi:hypothetical protein
MTHPAPCDCPVCRARRDGFTAYYGLVPREDNPHAAALVARYGQ